MFDAFCFDLTLCFPVVNAYLIVTNDNVVRNYVFDVFGDYLKAIGIEKKEMIDRCKIQHSLPVTASSSLPVNGSSSV